MSNLGFHQLPDSRSNKMGRGPLLARPLRGVPLKRFFAGELMSILTLSDSPPSLLDLNCTEAFGSAFALAIFAMQFALRICSRSSEWGWSTPDSRQLFSARRWANNHDVYNHSTPT